LNKVPTNWHLCDGTNGTPDLTGRFLEGVTDGVGQFHSAGLPNITGEFGNCEEFSSSFSGAFNPVATVDGAASEDEIMNLFHNILYYRLVGDKESGYSLDSWQPFSSVGVQQGYNVIFNASKSSSIYGASSTVQPNSYAVYYIMRIK